MYPNAYIKYLVYFHGPRDYFECHEVLEEYWKEKKAGEREIHWVALIQIAVSLYHHRLGNFSGAKKLLKNAIRIIKTQKSSIEELALDSNQLLVLLNKQLLMIENKKPYESVNLPITDPDLMSDCKKKCIQFHNCNWGDPSDLSNENLIKKHTLRDRTDVIKEREIQKKKRDNR